MRDSIFSSIDRQLPQLSHMADEIYDHPEKGFEEYHAQKILCDYLEENGFAVERGVGGVKTAFRAMYQNGVGGPAVGMYCEYDCLPIGHACGHHLQGPGVLGAAVAVKEVMTDPSRPYTIVIYGTPAEEGGGGKIPMISSGCFRELDVIMGAHAGAETTTDPRTYAARTYTVRFRGNATHTAYPEQCTSPMDALLLAMEGMEYMREHVDLGVKLHYTPLEEGLDGLTSTTPEVAAGKFALRSMSNTYMNELIVRFNKIIQGAAMMTDTTYEMEEGLPYQAKFPIPSLIDLFYQKAAEAGCKRIDPPRTRVGSSDFGDIMQIVPGIGTRIEFAPKGTGAHSLEWLKLGKSEPAHNFIRLAARTLALMNMEIIKAPHPLLDTIKEEYFVEREKSNHG